MAETVATAYPLIPIPLPKAIRMKAPSRKIPEALMQVALTEGRLSVSQHRLLYLKSPSAF
jgi:hypothetical protein